MENKTDEKNMLRVEMNRFAHLRILLPVVAVAFFIASLVLLSRNDLGWGVITLISGVMIVLGAIRSNQLYNESINRLLDIQKSDTDNSI